MGSSPRGRLSQPDGDLPVQRMARLLEPIRLRVAASALGPFAHAPYPLDSTLEHDGDAGLFGPGAVSWHVIADPAAFVGGIRGLLIQAAHPEVVAGVGDHSRYRDDPLGRLSRTSAYITATTFGARPEVEAAVAQVERIHRRVKGVSSRGIEYDASTPSYAAWVHNVLTDSFLTAHQMFGGRRLTIEEMDRFVVEQTRVGALLGADPMPETANDLRRWIEAHPDIEASHEMEDAVRFLTDPPLDPTTKAGYKVLMEAAAATIPLRIRDILGIGKTGLAIPVGRAAVGALRWALGYSPSWELALRRSGAPVPEGMFKRLIPSAGV